MRDIKNINKFEDINNNMKYFVDIPIDFARIIHIRKRINF